MANSHENGKGNTVKTVKGQSRNPQAGGLGAGQNWSREPQVDGLMAEHRRSLKPLWRAVEEAKGIGRNTLSHQWNV